MENDKFNGFVMRRKGDLALLLVGLFMGIYFDWTAIEILIFLIFLWSLLGPIASCFLVTPALFFLILTPILLLFKRPERAEEFSVYAFYFLVMAVVRAVIEIRGENDHKKDTQVSI